jgi:anti-sigma B factor antagonist
MRHPDQAVMSEQMQLRTEVVDIAGWTVVSVFGEVDVATAPELKERLTGLVNEGRVKLVLDLSGVDFLDSTGLGMIVSALKRARTHGGDLSIVCTESRITRLFEITGLDKALTVLPSVDAAVAGR